MNIKLRIRTGDMELDFEGPPEFAVKELPAFMKLLSEVRPSKSHLKHSKDVDEPDHPEGSDPGTLAKYLERTKAKESATRRCLAAAAWVQLKGKSRWSVSDISRALKDANQKKLSNPSKFVAENRTKGFIEADGKMNFVTSDGFEELAK